MAPPKKPRQPVKRKQRQSKKRQSAAQKRQLAHSGRWWKSRRLWVWLGSVFVMGVLAFLIMLAWFSRDLPSVSDLYAYEKETGIRIYDSGENLIGSYGHVMGKHIPYEHIPPMMVKALLATEDRRFFEHDGIDPLGIARAMYKNVMAAGVVQGGSTITQQLAKNAFLTSERTLKRKLQELILSIWLEGHLSKEKILELYLNRVYLGGGNYGIDAAAQYYFEKTATDLTLQESALLVGLLKAPSRYAPTRDKALSFKRTQQVLLNMLDAEMITEREATQAISAFGEMINLKENFGDGSRYFADWIIDRIPRYIGRIDGDLKVKTTLDPRLQSYSEQKIAEVIAAYGKTKDVSQAMSLTLTPQGAIKAMVGGVDYQASQFNRVTQAKRQPGSAFKLFVYLVALEAGMTPNSWVEDKPVRFGKWAPRNSNGRYLGEMLLREAFYRSANTVAAQLISQYGVGAVIDKAKQLGIKSELKPELALALGSSEVTMLELVTAFAHLANDGYMVEPYGIAAISLKDGGEVYKHEAYTPKSPVIRRSVVRMMNDLLTDTVAQGTGRGAGFEHPSAGKTGTSQNFRDAWFVGYTPYYVTGVWFGNDDNHPTKKVSGGSLPASVWKAIMQTAHKGKPVRAIPQLYYSADTPSQPLPWEQNGFLSDGEYDYPSQRGRNARKLPWE